MTNYRNFRNCSVGLCISKEKVLGEILNQENLLETAKSMKKKTDPVIKKEYDDEKLELWDLQDVIWDTGDTGENFHCCKVQPYFRLPHSSFYLWVSILKVKCHTLKKKRKGKVKKIFTVKRLNYVKSQHQEVLEEIRERGEAIWKTYLEWFRRMPLFLEVDGFRVVHACWQEKGTCAKIVPRKDTEKESRISIAKKKNRVKSTKILVIY